MKKLTKTLAVVTLLTGATLFAQTGTTQVQDIGMQKAKEIALAKAGFSENEVKKIKSKYSLENGIGEYEIEFKKDKMKYEYEINAQTGVINSIEIEEKKFFD